VWIYVINTDLEPDLYTGSIAINFADPDIPGKNIPVSYDVKSGPCLVISRDTINFGKLVKDGPSPQSKAFNISNGCGGILNWKLFCTDPCLSVTPEEGLSNNQDIAVNLDIAGLDVGEYDERVIINSANASNSPDSVIVIFEIIDPPIICVDYDQECFVADSGGIIPESKQVYVFNCGGGELDDLAIEQNIGWLDCTVISLTVNEYYLELTVNTTILPKGKYTGSIIFRSEKSTNKEVPVEICYEIK